MNQPDPVLFCSPLKEHFCRNFMNIGIYGQAKDLLRGKLEGDEI